MYRILIHLFIILFVIDFASLAYSKRQEHINHDMHVEQSDKVIKDMAGHDHDAMVSKEQVKEVITKVRVDEKLGSIIDLDTWFFDENGKKIALKELFDKPVVILPIYFFCPTICTFLQANLADVLNLVDQIPGEDFNVISLSFSDDENHEHAMQSKKNYTALLKKDFNFDKWYYLTGTKENIQRLTDSIGYYFLKQQEHLYIHPSALVVLSETGKITRYIYGPDFLAFDVGMALSEAEKGNISASIKRGVLGFCFNYDAKKKTYVFNVFRVAGTAILIFILVFVGFLLYAPKNKK